MRALVADDDPTSLAMLNRTLSDWDYDVVTAADGDRAWDILSSDDPPRLAVVDWMMPGLSGLDICQRLREAVGGRYVYTVLVTSRDEGDELREALDSGADDLVRKPFNRHTLKRRLAVGRRVASYDTELELYASEMEELAKLRAKQLLQADRMATLGVLSAGVAHEVNNPATFISGNVQTIKQFWGDVEWVLRERLEHTDGDEARKLAFVLEELPKALDGIHGGVKRIAKIVKGLKLYAGQQTSAKSVCTVDGCVERALDLCRYQLKKSTTLERDVPDTLPAIFADTQQIEQVIVNLVMNGVDAMEGSPNPTIRVSANGDDENITLYIEDNGPGIPDAVIEKIWDPFFTTKSAGKGTGLGLAICKSIVEDHGGQLSVENKHEGGARFRLSVPTHKRSPT